MTMMMMFGDIKKGQVQGCLWVSQWDQWGSEGGDRRFLKASDVVLEDQA